MSLQYPVTVYPDADGGYVAEIKDLPGCVTQGETLEETMANINEARELWLETVYENGDKIPLPATDDTYSGNFIPDKANKWKPAVNETCNRIKPQ